jgi:hypothetical protein
MNLKDVTSDLRQQNSYRLEQRFNKMLRTNPSYKNLSPENRSQIMDLIKEYQDKLRRNIPVSDYTVRHDMHRIYEHRFDMKLTIRDLDQIRDLLESFKA